jgi:hypothetical protein
MKIHLIAPAIVVATIIFLSRACDSEFLCQPQRIAELDVHNNRSVSVYADGCWEVGRFIYKEVRDSGKVIASRSKWFGDSGVDEYNFQVIYAKNESIIAIYDPTKSIDEVFLLINFNTGRVFSGTGIHYDKASLPEWIDVFEQLRKENPNLSILKYP